MRFWGFGAVVVGILILVSQTVSSDAFAMLVRALMMGLVLVHVIFLIAANGSKKGE